MTGPVPIAAAAAYLLGSVPFGLLLTRWGGAGDLRRVGSGNIGATNVLRTGRKGLAAATLLLDGSKAALAVCLATRLAGPRDASVPAVAAFAAVLGHVFPVWLRFRGGKGVASGLGALLALAWPAGVAASATWLAGARATRVSSVGALFAFALAPLWTWWAAGPVPAGAALAIALLVIGRHRGNVARLIAGTEPRVGR